jgi:hypothetical protein
VGWCTTDLVGGRGEVPLLAIATSARLPTAPGMGGERWEGDEGDPAHAWPATRRMGGRWWKGNKGRGWPAGMPGSGQRGPGRDVVKERDVHVEIAKPK